MKFFAILMLITVLASCTTTTKTTTTTTKENTTNTIIMDEKKTEDTPMEETSEEMEDMDGDDNMGMEDDSETMQEDTTEVEVDTTVEVQSDNTTLDDIDALINETLESVKVSEENVQAKIEVIAYQYQNPKQTVNMNIEYSLDSDGKIAMLDVTSDNYGPMVDFNSAAQTEIVGLTLEEASEVDVVSGASLTTGAFKEAIKAELK